MTESLFVHVTFACFNCKNSGGVCVVLDRYCIGICFGILLLILRTT
ncbi:MULTISPECIES: hypothetical protein [Methanobacterium]|nr:MULTISPECIES: hypothetical protein [Methanobacterium]